MPLLARMLASPLVVEISSGALRDLPLLLQRTHISVSGKVLVALGPHTQKQIWSRVGTDLRSSSYFVVHDATLETAGTLQAELAQGGYDAVVAIGGGRVLDVAKYAATRSALPLVVVATNLAHDGICSPVASLVNHSGKGSYGVALPLGVVVDLDYVRGAPRELLTAGVGDVISNLVAAEDWQLGARERGEPIDGLALAMSRTAAEAVIARTDSVESGEFLRVLAESLVLSGLAMSVAGTSRPCSGACHEILHSLDLLHPGRFNHGEMAGIGALFASHLHGHQERFDQMHSCLARHGLARTPADLDLTQEDFVHAVLAAPATRPDRYTVLEYLELDKSETRDAVAAFVKRVALLA